MSFSCPQHLLYLMSMESELGDGADSWQRLCDSKGAWIPRSWQRHGSIRRQGGTGSTVACELALQLVIWCVLAHKIDPPPFFYSPPSQP